MLFQDGLSRRDLLAGGAALALAPAAPAGACSGVEETLVLLNDFRVASTRPAGGASLPVLLWLPVVCGPAAPMHLGVARRLAAAGYHVLTPELPQRRIAAERGRDIAAVLTLAPGRSGSGAIGYDGGAGAARLALSTTAEIRAGLIYPGPLAANRIARPALAGQPSPDGRLLEHPGCEGLEAAAEAALTGGLAWLAAHGVARLS